MNYYAWSNIVVGKEGTIANPTARPGDVVTPASLGVSDAQFAEMIDSRAIRNTPFPVMPDGFGGSPHQLFLERLAAAQDDVEKAMEVMMTGNPVGVLPDLPTPEHLEPGTDEEEDKGKKS